MGLVFAMLLPLIAVQPPPVVSAEVTHQELALGFLGDVVGLDLSRYEVKLKWYNDYSSYSNRLFDADATYNISSDGSQLTAQFFFKNDAKLLFFISDLKGPMLLTQSPTNVLDAAKGFMNRYQGFTRAQYIQPLREMLYNVSELKNMTSIVGDVTFKVEVDSLMKDFVVFEWMNMPNGIYNRYTIISLMFHNGVLEQFTDNWKNCVMGSSEVNVSQEQAISLAKEHIAAYSYLFGNKTIGNLTVGDTDVWVRANLSMEIKKDNRLYPCWELLIPLAKVYPGFVTAMRVYLWADTGELSLIEKSGGGGIPGTSGDASFLPAEEPTSLPSYVGNNPASSIPAVAVFAVAIPLVIAAIIAILAINKKRKK
jgi:hypothetical protein